VHLTWSASTDNAGVTGYKIYRGDVHIATNTAAGAAPATSYTDSTVSGTITYSYRITAHDAAGNNSPPSNTVTIKTPDTFVPSAPTSLTASAVNATSVNLSWQASSDSGGSGLAGYRIYRNGAHIASTGQTSYLDTAVNASAANSYQTFAYDNAGNTSAASNTASVTVPFRPQLSYLGGGDSSEFSVTWQATGPALHHYHLQVNGSIETLYPPTTWRSFSGGDMQWWIRIRACNASDQCSAWSEEVFAHTCPPSGCQ
jgi:chitodextrinase